MKICPKCGETKAMSEFVGLRQHSHCKACRLLYHRLWDRTNRARKHGYYAKSKPFWSADRIERQRASRKAYVRRLKEEVMRHYSGGHPCCACCGERTLEFLVVDHLDGSGNAHRREVGARGSSFYMWLARNKFPAGFRVLCHNCNASYAHHSCCPHNDVVQPIWAEA